VSDERADVEPALTLGDASLQVSHLLAVGQRRRAHELALQLVSAMPESARAHFVLAQVLLASGDTAAALVAASEAVRLAPDDPLPHYGRARALFVLGRFADAECAVLEAIRLDPDDGDYHLLLARLLDVCDRRAAALQAVETTLVLEPESVPAHELRSRLLLRLDPRDWSISEESARRALALDPDSATAHGLLGAVLLHAGKRTEAEERFRDALLLDPQEPLARRGLAETVMASSPFYAPFLRYTLWMERAGMATAIAVVAGLWALDSGLQAWMATSPRLAPWRGPVDWLYLALCAYTWFARPITRWILARRHPWLRELSHA
jgi:Flp pilus assembly protein TadD